MEEVAHASRETVEAVEGVYLTPLAAGDRMSVQHFHVESGAEVPEHSHEHEQVGYVVRGTFTFETGDGESFVVGSGDSYAIPGGEVHAARNESAEPVAGIDVFSPPRTDPDWRE